MSSRRATRSRESPPSALPAGTSLAKIKRLPVSTLWLYLNQYHLAQDGTKTAKAKRLYDYLQAQSGPTNSSSSSSSSESDSDSEDSPTSHQDSRSSRGGSSSDSTESGDQDSAPFTKAQQKILAETIDAAMKSARGRKRSRAHHSSTLSPPSDNGSQVRRGRTTTRAKRSRRSRRSSSSCSSSRSSSATSASTDSSSGRHRRPRRTRHREHHHRRAARHQHHTLPVRRKLRHSIQRDDRLKQKKDTKSAAQPPVADFSEPRGSTPDDDVHPEVFISYKWEGGVPEFADAIAAELEKRRIGHWKDDHQMGPGDNITKRVAKGITKCKLFLPILSEGYISERGEKWCQRECALAVDKGKIFVPIEWGKIKIPDDIKFSIKPDTLRAKYEPGAGPATRKQQLRTICDAVQEQLRPHRSQS